jgi:hypothetical protein
MHPRSHADLGLWNDRHEAGTQPLDRIRCLTPGWPATTKERVARRVTLAYPSRSMETARARCSLCATFAFSFGFAFRR